MTISQGVSLAGRLFLFGLVAGESWLLLNLLRQNGRLLLRIEALEKKLGLPNVAAATSLQPSTGLPLGTPAPPFSLSDVLTGQIMTLDALCASKTPVLLVFTDPDCAPCTALLP